MDKQKWYFENANTGEFTDIWETADWWAGCGDSVNYWRWSEVCQEWAIFMVREA